MKRWYRLVPLAVVAVVVGALLYLLALSTGRSHAYGQWYLWLLIANVGVGLALLGVIVFNLWRLIRALRRSRTGARLTRRLVVLFIALAVLPVAVVFYFSVQFINHSIDSWFDVNVAHALKDSLVLSRQVLASQTGPYAGVSAQAARMLSERGPEPLDTALARLRKALGASRTSVFDSHGQVLATNAATSSAPLSESPPSDLATQLAQGGARASLYSVQGNLYVRTFALLDASDGTYRVLETLYPVNNQSSDLARRVESAYSRYQELSYLRQPLKLSFTLTLTLVLLLSLLAAVWAAFFAAARVAAPIQALVRATRAVAQGDFGVRVAEKSRDEIGVLARSFNNMTRGLAEARDATRRGQLALESERSWLVSVLDALSAGVITIDAAERVRSINKAAAGMLGIDATTWEGRTLVELITTHPPFAALFDDRMSSAGKATDVRVRLAGEERVVRAAFSRLESFVGEWMSGQIWVFEDVTEFVLAQREAAWGEVARRLAHEIKNPLTPIQLAAERLRLKCLPMLEGHEADILDRSTATVIAQVHAMQAMVDAFSEYAKSPPLKLAPVEVGLLVRELSELYRDRAGLKLTVNTAAGLLPVPADAVRLRQILHNLIKNAIEAQPEGHARVWLGVEPAAAMDGVALTVRDAGPGFDPDVLSRVFEPYVTTKHKGTGLGLALVRKLTEEQGGSVALSNLDGGGAEVIVTLPRRQQALRVVDGGRR
ncbi:MAG: ATP-binding protein [Gammaproteobacteria bacterium]